MKKTLIALFALAGTSFGATCIASIEELDQSKINSYFNFDTGNSASISSTGTTWSEKCIWNEDGYATSTKEGSHNMYTTSLGLSAVDGFTVSFDINSFTSGTILSICSNGAANAGNNWRAIRLSTDNDGSLNLHWCEQSFDSGITSDMLDWTTLTIVCKTDTANVVSLYVDGVFNNSITLTTNPANFKSEGVTKAQMGYFGNSNYSATSTIDNVLFYKEALSASEVAALVVPEPATASLSLLGLAALMIRRRRA